MEFIDTVCQPTKQRQSAAIKLARKWAYQVKGVPRHQAEIITAAGNFHGRTITQISFSTEPLYREDFGPFTPGFVSVPYGDAAAVEQAITPNTAAPNPSKSCTAMIR